ncbi:hypothetical protein DASC09_026460 [Saccharomycopsis crataegensis]|uniref:RGS domain-containing protein n=1 Tax=Saccharomycopsis crataegensis TaxID=43959 RepID=A0AAV5QKV8_9ASCO|nr:hypothetical protein DASC09_026460 [Saccharomycopsis crataegensis]
MQNSVPSRIPNLDTILRAQSLAPYSLHEFQVFLKKSRCFENYEFIQELDSLHQLPNISAKKIEWLRILRCYVEVFSEFEINLNGELRSKLLGNFDFFNNDYSQPEDLGRLDLPEKSVLNEARNEAYCLLHDAYLQFLKSVANREDNSVFIDKFNIYNHLEESGSMPISSGNYCFSTPPPTSGSCHNKPPSSNSRGTSMDEIPGLDVFLNSSRVSSPVYLQSSITSTATTNTANSSLPSVCESPTKHSSPCTPNTVVNSPIVIPRKLSCSNNTRGEKVKSMISQKPRWSAGLSKDVSNGPKIDSGRRDSGWKRVGRKLKLF